MSHPIAGLMKPYFNYYLPVHRGVSDNTIASYRDAIKLLLQYLADSLKQPVDTLDIETITESRLQDFFSYLQREQGCSPQTCNARLAAIRSFFSFVAREKPDLLAQCQQIRTIPKKRTQHKNAAYLKETETQTILNAVDTESTLGIRDQALLLLMYNTGARVSEVVSIKLGDLQLLGRKQVLLHGKGGKQRSCPLWPETVDALKGYIQQRNPKETETQLLFLNANGVPVTRFGIRYIINKYAKIAAIQCPSINAKNVTPHTFRHTTAMHLLRSGNDVNMVSYWLGHASIDTTHFYLEIDMEMKRKMLEKTNAPVVNGKAKWQKPGILEWLSQLGHEPELCRVGRGCGGQYSD